MNIQEYEITIVTTSGSGILASLMRAVGSKGLMYRRNKMLNEDGLMKVVLTVRGRLAGLGEELKSEIELLPQVKFVESIVEVSSSTAFRSKSNEVEQTKAKIKKTAERKVFTDKKTVSFKADDLITSEALAIAKEKLSDVLGPVAAMLVKQVSMTMNVTSVGQLFSLLAEELNDNAERAEFLSVVMFDDTLADVNSKDEKSHEAVAPEKAKGFFS